ncbi:MAG: radical SAM protein [Candidatus Pacebacteria bacterium]|nr:radical SAM protein [Candidatus Paceibacterota bacterium]
MNSIKRWLTTIKRYFQFLGELLKVPLKYKKSVWYLLRKKGIKSACNFLFIKYFVSDEGGEVALLNSLIGETKMSSLAPYPFKLEVEHTTVCNKKCIMCEHTYWQEKPERLTIEQFKNIVDQFPKLKWINLTGEGDNFLNPDYMKFIEYARSKDISVNFVDEFDFIDSNVSRRLVELGVNCIWISMDGATKETYEKIKVNCNFERALTNIKTLLAVKKELGSPFPTLCFRFIINKINYQEMPKMVELVHSLGDLGEESRLEFAGLLTFKEIEHLYVPQVPQEIVTEVKRKAEELKVNVSFSHYQKNALKSINKCTAWMEPYIMMGGYVMPCCAVLMSNRRDFLRKYAMGNIYEKSFKEIWNSERYKKFRKMVNNKNEKVPILCVGCRGYNTKEREKNQGVSASV